MRDLTAVFSMGTVACLALLWATGANDVANAMGTSVGSRVISLRTASILAGCMEFLGALLVGSGVASTLSSELVDHDGFHPPSTFVMGMFSALVGSFAWLVVATAFSLPVSSTHAIAGSIIAFALVQTGTRDINGWLLFTIAISWFTSPVVGAIFSALLYKVMLVLIFQHENPHERAQRYVPGFVGFTVATLVIFIMSAGPPLLRPDVPWYILLVIFVGVMAVVTALVFVFFDRLEEAANRTRLRHAHLVKEEAEHPDYESQFFASRRAKMKDVSLSRRRRSGSSGGASFLATLSERRRRRKRHQHHGELPIIRAPSSSDSREEAGRIIGVGVADDDEDVLEHTAGLNSTAARTSAAANTNANGGGNAPLGTPLASSTRMDGPRPPVPPPTLRVRGHPALSTIPSSASSSVSGSVQAEPDDVDVIAPSVQDGSQAAITPHPPIPGTVSSSSSLRPVASPRSPGNSVSGGVGDGDDDDDDSDDGRMPSVDGNDTTASEHEFRTNHMVNQSKSGSDGAGAVTPDAHADVETATPSTAAGSRGGETLSSRSSRSTSSSIGAGRHAKKGRERVRSQRSTAGKRASAGAVALHPVPHEHEENGYESNEEAGEAEDAAEAEEAEDENPIDASAPEGQSAGTTDKRAPVAAAAAALEEVRNSPTASEQHEDADGTASNTAALSAHSAGSHSHASLGVSSSHGASTEVVEMDTGLDIVADVEASSVAQSNEDAKTEQVRAADYREYSRAETSEQSLGVSLGSDAHTPAMSDRVPSLASLAHPITPERLQRHLPDSTSAGGDEEAPTKGGPTEATHSEVEGEENKPKDEVERAEGLFAGLLVMSACAVAFAHGGNDVANAIGPYNVLFVYETENDVDPEHAVPWYILAMGGLCIVIGLVTWGYRVIQTVGSEITALTLPKGYAAQFGAALSVLIATTLGVPISTTAVLIGSIMGVGLVDGSGTVDFATIRHILTAWLITLPAAGAVCAAMFAITKVCYGLL